MFTRQAAIVIGLAARNIFSKLCHGENEMMDVGNENMRQLCTFPPISNNVINTQPIENVAQVLEKDNRKYRIDDYTERCKNFMCEHKVPGLQLAVSVDGKIVWNEAFGHYDLEDKHSCHCYTTMRIDQISMPLTALIALKVKSTDLDKGWKNQAEILVDPAKIWYASDTLKNLLDNNAGIVDQLDDDFWLNFKDKDYKSEIENYLGVTERNEQHTFRKSIMGYLLAAACLEIRYGNTSYEVLFKNVFGPLKLCGTEIEKGVITFATKYYQKSEDGTVELHPYINTSLYQPAAGLVSCARDLVKICNTMLYSSQFNKINFDYAYFDTYETKKMFENLLHLGDMKSHSRGWDVKMIKPKEEQKEKYLMQLSAEGKGPGASSAVVIHKPTNDWPFPDVNPEGYGKESCGEESKNQNKTSGVVVSVLMNLSNVPALELAEELTNAFYDERCID